MVFFSTFRGRYLHLIMMIITVFSSLWYFSPISGANTITYIIIIITVFFSTFRGKYFHLSMVIVTVFLFHFQGQIPSPHCHSVFLHFQRQIPSPHHGHHHSVFLHFRGPSPHHGHQSVFLCFQRLILSLHHGHYHCVFLHFQRQIPLPHHDHHHIICFLLFFVFVLLSGQMPSPHHGHQSVFSLLSEANTYFIMVINTVFFCTSKGKYLHLIMVIITVFLLLLFGAFRDWFLHLIMVIITVFLLLLLLLFGAFRDRYLHLMVIITVLLLLLLLLLLFDAFRDRYLHLIMVIITVFLLLLLLLLFGAFRDRYHHCIMVINRVVFFAFRGKYLQLRSPSLHLLTTMQLCTYWLRARRTSSLPRKLLLLLRCYVVPCLSRTLAFPEDDQWHFLHLVQTRSLLGMLLGRTGLETCADQICVFWGVEGGGGGLVCVRVCVLQKVRGKERNLTTHFPVWADEKWFWWFNFTCMWVKFISRLCSVLHTCDILL